MLSSKQEFNEIDNITIYTGTSEESRDFYTKSIAHLQDAFKGEKLFNLPLPSTLTAQGLMSNISFDERELFDMLSEPTGCIMRIGCNFGKMYNKNYVKPVIVKKSGRGRKPKPKEKKKRRTQGTGDHFSSQITFVIQHPDTNVEYKIKLFRNGVFQVPGVKNPTMEDLVKPIEILRQYLLKNFDEDVQVIDFIAVMRNYKAKILDANLFVNLIELEDIITAEKSFISFEPFIKYSLSALSQHQLDKAMKFIGKTNPLNIAEITYNTDKCFCLALKFYRPMLKEIDKKTTVKLLKKGKINFDGGNSELEMLELYHWLELLYKTYADKILVDTSKIENNYDESFIKLINENVDNLDGYYSS